MSDPHYPNRIVVYIDLLGFKRDVLLEEVRPGVFLTNEAVLSVIANCSADIERGRAAGTARDDVRMEYVSDSIFLSLADQRGAMRHAMALSAFLAQVILRRGYICRGAIAIGPLSHSDQIVWGRSVVEAVEMEQRTVETPRIAFSPAAAVRAREEIALKGDAEHDFIRDRGNGPFVHVLGNRWPFLTEEMKKLEDSGIAAGDVVAAMYNEMREALILRFENAPDERARNKLRWLATYINDTVDENGGPPEWRVVLPETPFRTLLAERIKFLKAWLAALKKLP